MGVVTLSGGGGGGGGGGGDMVGCNNACAWCAVHSNLIHVVSMAGCSS